MADESANYTPSFSAEEIETLRRWHEVAYTELRDARERHVTYLDLDLVVPGGVFAPTPTSDLLGRAVLDEVRENDRVLDMGTGSGVNAVLAASRSRDVLGVDINPHAVAAAIDNAARNGVSARTTFRVSDLFEAVDGTFDIIVYDPPFRWFRPRDLCETSIADENYGSLTRFMQQASGFLNADGRVLVFFGTSGDMKYLTTLIDRAGFNCSTVAERDLTRDFVTVTYRTLRLTR
jgi:release factor glutamine methyltransferase